MREELSAPLPAIAPDTWISQGVDATTPVSETSLAQQSTPHPIGDGKGAEVPSATSEQKFESCAASIGEVDDQSKSPLSIKFWSFIASGEYGIAHNLALAGESTGSAVMRSIAPPSCTRLLALGSELSYPQGAIARAVEEAVAGFDPTPIGHLPDEEALATNLLLVAATLRSALLAPATGAPGILRREVSLGPGWDHLHNLIKQIASSSDILHGMILGPDAFRQCKYDKSIEQLRESLKAEAEQWTDAAAKSRLSFQPASFVWHHWVAKEKDGHIYRLLAPVMNPEVLLDDGWRTLLSDLADPATVETMVQASDRELRGSRYGNIDYKALDQIQRRVFEAVQMVRRWMALNDAKPKTDFIERNIRSLADKLEALREPVSSEIEAASKRAVAPVRAAANCLGRETAKLWALFDPTAQLRAPDERSPSAALNEDMLLVPGAHLSIAGHLEADPGDVLGMISGYSAGSMTLEAAAESKIVEGDFDAAERLIDRLSTADSEKASSLSQRFDIALEEARAAAKVARSKAIKKLESGFRAGLVSDVDRDRMASELTDLELRHLEWRRFDKSRAILGKIAASIADSSGARIRGIRDRFSKLVLAVDDKRYQTIENLLARGDAFAAEEYIDHVARGETPPTSGSLTDASSQFQSFLTAVTDAVNLAVIEQAIQHGKDWGPATFSSFTEEGRSDALSLVRSWNAVKRFKSSAGDPRFDAQKISALITAIGFRPVEITEGKGGRSSVRLEVSMRAQMIADRRICPIPEFGSEAKGAYRLVCIWPKTGELDATEVTTQGRASSAATIVLFLGPLSREGRLKLLRQNIQAKRAWLVIDDVLLLYLATHAQGRLSAFFSATLPYSAANPYRAKAAGTVQPEMFFGRAREREAIVAPQGASFVYGGRQLGKTALIKEVERLLHRPSEDSIVLWLDLPGHGIGRSAHPENLWTLIVRELHHFSVVSTDWPEFKPDDKNVATIVEDIRRWIDKHSDGRILLLLDEADEFLREDAQSDYAVTRTLKSMMERTGGHFKTVFVGLHNVLRSTQHANNPLVHLGAAEIGPLYARGESREAFEMVRGPFAALGYTFADDSLILRILGSCNYYPILINYYCRRLLERLRDRIESAGSAARQANVITEAMVSEIYDSTELRDEIKHYFLATLHLDARYMLIANWLALEYLQGRMDPTEGLPVVEIRNFARALWPDGFRATTDQEFDSLLSEMVGLGVLRRTDDHQFTFRNPNVLQLMGTPTEIDDRLTKIAVEGEIKPGFDAMTFRGPMSSSPHNPHRSPLTIAQEAKIATQENGVSLVCGATLSEIAAVSEALSQRHAISNVVTSSSLSVDMLMKEVEHLRANPKPGINVMVVSETKPWTMAWVDKIRPALQARKSTTSFVRVVFLAGANQLWGMAKDGYIGKLADSMALPLKPWTDSYLWTWLEDINIPPDRSLRRRILDATDGRAGLIMQLHAGLDMGPRVSESVEGFNVRLNTPESASATLGGLGILNEDAKRGLRLITDLPGETTSELSKFWPDDGVPAVKLEDFVRWGEMLSLIRQVGTDRWEVEPFVGRILKAASTA